MRITTTHHPKGAFFEAQLRVCVGGGGEGNRERVLQCEVRGVKVCADEALETHGPFRHCSAWGASSTQ